VPTDSDAVRSGLPPFGELLDGEVGHFLTRGLVMGGRRASTGSGPRIARILFASVGAGQSWQGVRELLFTP
jgi:hypothetical protein